MDATDAGRVDVLKTSMDLCFSWDYGTTNAPMRDLYTRGKGAQWDGMRDLDWLTSVDPEGPGFPDLACPIYGSDIWEKLTVREQRRVKLESTAWMLSQFLHGEQGALLATSQLVAVVPSTDAKFNAACQVMDEARHVEVYDRYLRDKIGIVNPVTPTLKTLLDTILTDGRWDMKYLGMQILVEGLALAAFGIMRAWATEPLIRDLTRRVIQDEARHVAFGVMALKDVYRDLPVSELRDREDFVIEGCRLMRDRFLAQEVWGRMGLPEAECMAFTLASPIMSQFRCMLFSKIVPNLKRLGLLTPRVRPALEDLGVLAYENLDPDAVTDDA